jgi:hypothetical protein
MNLSRATAMSITPAINARSVLWGRRVLPSSRWVLFVIVTHVVSW